MKQNLRFFTHTNTLFALFILGNAVIVLPSKNADKFSFLGFLVAAVLGVALYLIALPAAKILFSGNIANKNLPFKIFSAVVFLTVAVFAAFCAADTFSDFASFVKDILLKDTTMFFIAAIFLFVVIFFSIRRQEDTLKFFLIAFWFSLAIISFFFVALAFRFDLKNIYIFELPKLKELYSQTKPYILNPVLPTVLLPIYKVAVFGKSRASRSLAGVILGYLLLGLCVVSAVLLFGSALAGKLEYPYSSAVSTVSIGRLFSRLDGFSYFIYFVAALAKITVSIFVARKSVERIKKLFD